MDSDLFKTVKGFFPSVKASFIKKLFLQSLQGIHYMHTEKNMVHNDIKPENIGITGENAVLMDFEYAAYLNHSAPDFAEIKKNWK
jgi:serine/threonine protein kinase